jgi:hypothetical protein
MRFLAGLPPTKSSARLPFSSRLTSDPHRSLGELAADDAEKEQPRLDGGFTRKDRVSPLIEVGGYSAR